MKNKIKFQLGNNNLECKLHYRSYDIDAFGELKGNQLKEVTVITYTSEKSLKTVFTKCRTNFEQAKNIKLVIGIHHPKKISSNSEFEANLITSLGEITDELNIYNDYWKNVNLDFTLHNHCHIKYIHAGPFCFAGSQNFTGTIDNSTKRSNYPKNELIVSVIGHSDELDELTFELYECLHHEKDEFLWITKEEITAKDFSSKTFTALREQRVSTDDRKSFEGVHKLLQDKYYSDMLHDIESTERLEALENENKPPELFQFHEHISNLLSEDHKHPFFSDIEDEVRTLKETLSMVETYIGDNSISLKIAEIIEVITKLDIVKFPHSSSLINPQLITRLGDNFRNDILALLSSEISNAIDEVTTITTLKAKQSLYSLALENIKDILSELQLDDINEFKKEHNDRLALNIADNSDLLSEHYNIHYIEPDLLSDLAYRFIDESLQPSQIFRYFPNEEEALIDEVTDGLINVASNLAIEDINA